MHIKSKKAFRIVLSYMFFGFMWILFSDKLLYTIAHNTHTYYTLSVHKGAIFVIFTTFLLLKMMDNNISEYKDNKKIINEKEQELKEISKNYRVNLQKDIVRSFIRALEIHDDYTKGHSEEVAYYCMKMGKALNLSDKNLEDLYWAAIMHDIGKIIIPVEVLNKKERLSESEYELIKGHSRKGYEILSESKTLKNISDYILYHHERWDGNGYPDGLAKDEIPILSQIVAVADSWHAMTSDRPYKKALSVEEGLKELIRNKGTQFSPKIVDLFIENEAYFISEPLLVKRVAWSKTE